MEIEPGIVAGGIAARDAAIAPPLLARVAPIDEALTTTTDATRAPKQPDLEVLVTLPDTDGMALPDAQTIATMQLMSKIPRDPE